jgi:hypothetical protein
MPGIRIALLIAAALLVAGCASTPQASRERDADAKQFETHPASAAVYVYRSEHDRLADAAVLYLDGRLIGDTLPGAYFRVDAQPGRRVLHGIGADQGRIAFDARPGQLYFIEMDVIEGQSRFRIVPERVGRERIAKCCAMLERWAPGQRPLLR